MFANALLLSAIQTYVIVGVLSCLLLPRSRMALVAAMRDVSWRRQPRLVHLAFCASAALVALVAWPLVLKSSYLQDPAPAPTRAGSR